MPSPNQPADADFEARVRDSFARQPAMATLGVAMAEVTPGRVVLAMTHRADLTQQHGFLHAGIVATALDSACGYAAFSLMPPEAAVLTIEFKINLLAPARGPLLRFEGRVTKAGRTISVADGQAWQRATAGGDETLVATLTATVMTVLGRGIAG
ncbi:MAG: PaaI family thioesterase [Rubrivivax sp.]|nr:PaaI family thioesterase [Rubrivivax sp.]